MFYLLLFLFPCNGHLSYWSIPHLQMDKNTHHRIVTPYQQAANSYIIGYKVKR